VLKYLSKVEFFTLRRLQSKYLTFNERAEWSHTEAGKVGQYFKLYVSFKQKVAWNAYIVNKELLKLGKLNWSVPYNCIAVLYGQL